MKWLVMWLEFCLTKTILWSRGVWGEITSRMRLERRCFWTLLQALALLPTMALKGILVYYLFQQYFTVMTINLLLYIFGPSQGLSYLHLQIISVICIFVEVTNNWTEYLNVQSGRVGSKLITYRYNWHENCFLIVEGNLISSFKG